MRVITLGSDRKLFEEGSVVRSRARMQSALFEFHTIVVFSLRSQRLREEYLAPHVRIVPTNSFSRLFYGWDAIRMGRKEKATLVSAQDPFETGLAALFLGRLLRIPVQVQIHTDFLSPYFGSHSLLNWIRVRIARFVIPRAACVRAVSNRIANSLKATFPTVRAAIVPVFATPGETSGEMQTFGYKEFFLITSRLEKEKDISLALRAFAKVSTNYPGLGLVIAGEGSERASLEQLTRMLGIDSMVTFAGWRNDLPVLRARALALLNTSRYEGYGLALVDAAREGCPILTTDVGITGELITKEDAFIVPVGKEETLVQAMCDVLKNKSEAEKRASRLKKKIGPIPSDEEYLSALNASFALCQKNQQ